MDNGLTPLFSKGGFALHSVLGRLTTLGFPAQNGVLAGLSAGLLIGAAAIDGSWRLPGRDVGLLEHPGIWGLLLLQAIVPIVLYWAAQRISLASEQLTAISGGAIDYSSDIESPALVSAMGGTPEGRLFGGAAFLLGFAVWAWNTYQNQYPNVILPFDFWDSVTFPAGYWITRVYKLYLLALFLPWLSIVYAAILHSMLHSLSECSAAGELRVIPFHSDRMGGFGFFPEFVTAPVVPSLLIAAIPGAGAFLVHRNLDIMPLSGALAIAVLFLAFYLLPIHLLRQQIISAKKHTLDQLGGIQQQLFEKLIKGAGASQPELERANEALGYYDRVEKRVNEIPNYPHLRRLLVALGIAFSPAMGGILLDLLTRLQAGQVHP